MLVSSTRLTTTARAGLRKLLKQLEAATDLNRDLLNQIATTGPYFAGSELSAARRELRVVESRLEGSIGHVRDILTLIAASSDAAAGQNAKNPFVKLRALRDEVNGSETFVRIIAAEPAAVERHVSPRINHTSP